MDIDKKLEALKKIREVEAPYFLLTRIRQQVHALENKAVPLQWKWAFAISGLFILVINLSVLFRSNQMQNKNTLEPIVSGLHLSATNELYHE